VNRRGAGGQGDNIPRQARANWIGEDKHQGADADGVSPLPRSRCRRDDGAVGA
jgi:hypothetical protein